MKTTTAPAGAAARPRSEILAAEIQARRRDHQDATAELGRLTEARPALLRTGTDAALEGHDRAMAKASRAIERATAQESDLRPQLAAAKVEEEQDRRRAIHARGKQAVATYRRLVESGYLPLAEKMAAVLRDAREQLEIIQAANAELPEGMAALDADAFRQPPSKSHTPPPAEIEALVWVDRDGSPCRPALTEKGGKMVPDIIGAHQVPRMIPNPALYGWRPPQRVQVQPLPSTVRLPGVLHADVAFWG